MNRATFDFTGTAVLVTGGTSGIGHAISTVFADAGADVTVTGTKSTAGDYDVDLARFAYRMLEVRDPASITALAESLDRLDVLVNNAGANFPGGRDEWEPARHRLEQRRRRRVRVGEGDGDVRRGDQRG